VSPNGPVSTFEFSRSLLSRFLCGPLLFRPTLALRGCDPFPCLGAHVTFLGMVCAERERCVFSEEKGANFTKTGKLGIDGGEEFGCIHARQYTGIDATG
jgi:hypothetical protein